jgi:prolyl oligopeptidase
VTRRAGVAPLAWSGALLACALGAAVGADALAAPVPTPARPLTDPRSIVSPTMSQAAPASVATLFSIPNSWDADATPDGRGLVYASDVTGRLNLWYVDTAGGTPRRLTTSEERHWGITVAPDSRTAVYMEDLGGAEMFDLHAVPVAGGPSRNLTRTPDASETGAVFARDGKQLAFSRRAKTAASAEIVVMDLVTGMERTLTAEKLPDRQWAAVAFSANGCAVYARRSDITGSVEDTLYRIRIADGRAEPVIRKPSSSINPVSDISPDERWLALSTETADGRKQAALFDIRAQKLRMLAPGPWEQRSLRFSPDGKTLLFLDNIDGRSVVKRHDIASARTETLPLPAGMNTDYFGKLPAETPDGRIVFPHQSGTEPLAYWSYDPKSGRNTAILRMAESEVAKLPPTQVVTYPAKDGTLISAILWTPANAPRDGSAAAVVIAHGGPTGQTEDRYDATAVALAARGYFVIAPNPRGSTGYGRDFMRANIRDLGGGDLEDYVAGVKFLVDTGYVDARRVGITGVSYGGYMTMIALGRAPDVFAAGVEVCGITNWTSMHERGSPALRAYQEGLIGHPVKDREVYERVSPLTYLDRYKAPLLVLQGDNDIRVPKFEAEQVVATLRRLGKPVDARYYPDEGHGFFKRENQVDAALRTIGWFDRHLRGVDASERMTWLEPPRDAAALGWARAETQTTRTALESRSTYPQVLAELKTALVASAPAPAVSLAGSRAVRLLQDASHPQGLLQVAPRARDGSLGAWRTVLDIAALREREGKPYVLQWYAPRETCLPPDFDRCLLRLSPAGADDAELREFDLVRGEFVADGFRVPASRVMAAWLDRDTVVLAHTVGEQPLTAAGWAAAARLWRRGEPLSAAREVFRAEPTDAILQVSAVGSGAQRRAVLLRAIDYSTFDLKLVDVTGRVEQVDLPRRLKTPGVLTMTGRHLVVQLAEDAEVEGRRYAAETLLSYDAAAPRGVARVQSVAAPVVDGILSDQYFGIAGTRDAVHYVLWRDLVPRLYEARLGPDGRWRTRQTRIAAAGESLRISDADRDGSDIVLTTTGYLTPTRSDVRRADGGSINISAETAVVDASKYVVEIREARAKDGVIVPYYLLRPKTLRKDGPTPTLMTGYGAFGLSVTPGYFDFAVGGRALKLWLERGGALVLPAIRGGGEKGAEWHRAAMREKRLVSYDDFAAVTESLIASAFTSPAHIGVFGLSNGGLLVATMATRRPDLYGAVVSDVPLADMLRFPQMGMGAAWMNEYGDPSDPAMATVLRSYSPVHAVKDGVRYPPFLVTASTEDNRVGPGHARKLAARVQEVGATAYLIEDDEGGHGVSDPLQRPELMAQRMTFLIDTLMGDAKKE